MIGREVIWLGCFGAYRERIGQECADGCSHGQHSSQGKAKLDTLQLAHSPPKQLASSELDKRADIAIDIPRWGPLIFHRAKRASEFNEKGKFAGSDKFGGYLAGGATTSSTH